MRNLILALTFLRSHICFFKLSDFTEPVIGQHQKIAYKKEAHTSWIGLLFIFYFCNPENSQIL